MIIGGVAIASEVYEFDCSSDCDAEDPISVETWIRSTGNLEVDRWRAGDQALVEDEEGDRWLYQYAPLSGTFVQKGPWVVPQYRFNASFAAF